MESICLTRSDPELCDANFLVGASEAPFAANSTLLALRSPYFKALLYGPLAGDRARPRLLPDVSPEAFARVLDYAHGSPDARRPFDSQYDAWQTLYASKQFLMTELETESQKFLLRELEYSTALPTLREASTCGAEELRKRALKTLRNRPKFVLASEDLTSLSVNDLCDILRLYRNSVVADTLLEAVLSWGKNLSDEDEFRKIFCGKFLRLIRLEKLSNNGMVALHESRLLPPELENEVMLKMLVSTTADPMKKEVRSLELMPPCVSNVEIRTEHSNNDSMAPPLLLKRLLLRTVISFKRQLAVSRRSGLLLDGEGLALLSSLLRQRPLASVRIPAADVSVAADVNRHGLHRLNAATVRAFAARVDNRDIFFLDVDLEEEELVFACENSGGSGDTLFVEVSLSAALLRDLADWNLAPGELVLERAEQVFPAAAPDPEFASSSSTRLIVKSWQTFQDGKLALSDGDTTPKYFFEGCGVPIVSALTHAPLK